MVPIQKCWNEIHWTLDWSSTQTGTWNFMSLGGHKETLWKQNRNQFCTNDDAYLFSTKLNFMDEVLFSYFLKTKFDGGIFFK